MIGCQLEEAFPLFKRHGPELTGATRNSVLALMWGLYDSGCQVVGADYRKLPFNLHSRCCGPYYFFPQHDEAGFLRVIISIVKKEKIDVLVPGICTDLVAKHRREIEQHTALLAPDHEQYLLAADNKKTLQECHRLGIGAPALFTREEAVDLIADSKHKGNPVQMIVKPRMDIGAAAGVRLVDTRERLQQAMASAQAAQAQEASMVEISYATTRFLRPLRRRSWL